MSLMRRIITFWAIITVLGCCNSLVAQEVSKLQYISNWTTYITETADGTPAEVTVDLGLQTVAPANGFQFQCSFLLKLNNPDSTGLHDYKDAENLKRLADRLEISMGWSKGVYYATVTSNGLRDYYYFVPDSSNFRSKCKRVMDDFPGYTYELQIEHDPYWFNYYNVFPDEYTVQIQYNEDKMHELLELGDSLTEPRVLQHFANFPSERDRTSFEEDLIRRGFKIVGTGENEGDLPFGILFSRKQEMDKEKIEEITLQLVDLSMQNGGYYDGWICEPVLPKKK
jgi:hypothetical protein